MQHNNYLTRKSGKYFKTEVSNIDTFPVLTHALNAAIFVYIRCSWNSSWIRL